MSEYTHVEYPFLEKTREIDYQMVSVKDLITENNIIWHIRFFYPN